VNGAFAPNPFDLNEKDGGFWWKRETNAVGFVFLKEKRNRKLL